MGWSSSIRADVLYDVETDEIIIVRDQLQGLMPNARWQVMARPGREGGRPRWFISNNFSLQDFIDDGLEYLGEL